jgi:hypothetical protein
VLIGLLFLVSLLQGAGSVYIAIFLIGVFQLVYLVPIGIRLRRIGHTATLQGVIVAGAITLLLNGACFALLGGVLISG